MPERFDTMIMVRGDDRAALLEEKGGWVVALVNPEGDRLYHTVRGQSIEAKRSSLSDTSVEVVVDGETACTVYFLGDAKAADVFAESVRTLGEKAAASGGETGA